MSNRALVFSLRFLALLLPFIALLLLPPFFSHKHINRAPQHVLGHIEGSVLVARFLRAEDTSKCHSETNPSDDTATNYGDTMGPQWVGRAHAAGKQEG